MEKGKDKLGSGLGGIMLATLFGFLFPLAAKWILLVLALLVAFAWFEDKGKENKAE